MDAQSFRENVVRPRLLLQTEAQALLDYSQTLITGDELMFIMDMPYVPVQETPIVLAQAATPGTTATPQPDYVLTECVQTESTGDPMSAMRAVDPAFMLKNYLEWHDKTGTLNVNLSSIKTTLLEGTKHGEIASGTTNYDRRTAYGYDPTPNYVGNDRAVFIAEFAGKTYKIVVNLVVSLQVNENPLTDEQKPVCSEPTLIKVNGKPVSGSLSNDAPILRNLNLAGVEDTARYRFSNQQISYNPRP